MALGSLQTPPPIMGYDIDRFTSAVDEGLLCSICRDVIEDGLQAPCEHAYCGACIRAWLVNENTCPDDRQALDVRELRPLFRYMRNRLAALAVRCRHAQAGCSEVREGEGGGGRARETRLLATWGPLH